MIGIFDVHVLRISRSSLLGSQSPSTLFSFSLINSIASISLVLSFLLLIRVDTMQTARDVLGWKDLFMSVI